MEVDSCLLFRFENPHYYTGEFFWASCRVGRAYIALWLPQCWSEKALWQGRKEGSRHRLYTVCSNEYLRRWDDSVNRLANVRYKFNAMVSGGNKSSEARKLISRKYFIMSSSSRCTYKCRGNLWTLPFLVHVNRRPPQIIRIVKPNFLSERSLRKGIFSPLNGSRK